MLSRGDFMHDEVMMCVGFLSDPTQGIRNIALLLFGF